MLDLLAYRSALSAARFERSLAQQRLVDDAETVCFQNELAAVAAEDDHPLALAYVDLLKVPPHRHTDEQRAKMMWWLRPNQQLSLVNIALTVAA